MLILSGIVIATILMVAGVYTAEGRPPSATWRTSFGLIGGVSAAMIGLTMLDPLLH